jgi:hypothetical protein
MTDGGVKRVGVAMGRKRRLSGKGGCTHDLALDRLTNLTLISATRNNDKYERKKLEGGVITQKLNVTKKGKEGHGQRDN